MGRWRWGDLDGLSESYFENGQLMNKTILKDGHQCGLSEGYYDNGQLRFQATYKGGRWMIRDGPDERYFPDGRLIEKRIYTMDERCGEWIVDKDQAVSPSDVSMNFREEVLTLLYDPCPRPRRRELAPSPPAPTPRHHSIFFRSAIASNRSSWSRSKYSNIRIYGCSSLSLYPK